jgi:hypothetical protein
MELSFRELVWGKYCLAGIFQAEHQDLLFRLLRQVRPEPIEQSEHFLILISRGIGFSIFTENFCAKVNFFSISCA